VTFLKLEEATNRIFGFISRISRFDDLPLINSNFLLPASHLKMNTGISVTCFYDLLSDLSLF
jgi:hypothetical protein